MPTLPAGTSAHAALLAGQTLKITQSQGPQVVDIWAFSLSPHPPHPGSISSSSTSKSTYLSMSHTRSTNLSLLLRVGDTLVSNTRSPMLTLIADTSGGVHDILFAACDAYRYAMLGAEEGHASCAANLRLELAGLKVRGWDLGIGIEGGLVRAVEAGWTPDPLNLFMHVPVAGLAAGEGFEEGARGGEMRIQRPRSRKGDHVVLRAEVDVVVVMSACPMDLNEVNGGLVRDVEWGVV